MRRPNILFGLILALALSSSPGAARATDVSYYGMLKAAQYLQTNDSAPALLATNPFVFTAFVIAATNHVVTNATVKPGNSTPARTLVDTNGVGLLFTESFTTQAAMDSVYPTASGFMNLTPVNYTFAIGATNDGIKTGTLNFFLLVIAVSYPTTPQLNLAAAQQIDTTRDFELSWNSLGGSSLAIVQLSILDQASNVVYMSAIPFQSGALNGASTSTVIPAYTLPPGTNLIGHLTIANPAAPNTNSYAGAIGVAGLAKDTQFPLVTRPAPQRPRIEFVSAAPARLRLTGESNRLHQIEVSDDLRLWTSVWTTNPPQASFEYTDPAQGSNRRWYRAKVGQ